MRTLSSQIGCPGKNNRVYNCCAETFAKQSETQTFYTGNGEHYSSTQMDARDLGYEIEEVTE